MGHVIVLIRDLGGLAEIEHHDGLRSFHQMTGGNDDRLVPVLISLEFDLQGPIGEANGGGATVFLVLVGMLR